MASLTFGITSIVFFFLVWCDKLWADGLLSPDCGLVQFSSLSLPSTALASFPGSGNTWLRSLIQDSTGYATGSEYLDDELYQTGFIGEGIGAPPNNSSMVVVVKTHNSDKVTLARFQRAILLVRNPKEAILAEFNRLYGGGHQRTAPLDMFQQYWLEFSKFHAKAWKSFHYDWLNFGGDLFVTFYSDLAARPTQELQRILTFIKLSSTEARINCAIGRGKRLRRLEASFRDRLLSFLQYDFNSAFELYYTIMKNKTRQF